MPFTAALSGVGGGQRKRRSSPLSLSLSRFLSYCHYWLNYLPSPNTYIYTHMHMYMWWRYTYTLTLLLYIAPPHSPHRPLPALQRPYLLHVSQAPYLGRDAGEGGMQLWIAGNGLQEAAEEGCAVL